MFAQFLLLPHLWRPLLRSGSECERGITKVVEIHDHGCASFMKDIQLQSVCQLLFRASRDACSCLEGQNPNSKPEGRSVRTPLTTFKSMWNPAVMSLS